jgi:hypothetical protein
MMHWSTSHVHLQLLLLLLLLLLLIAQVALDEARIMGLDDALEYITDDYMLTCCCCCCCCAGCSG